MLTLVLNIWAATHPTGLTVLTQWETTFVNSESQGFYSLSDPIQADGSELRQYMRSLSPETIALMSRPESKEVRQVMEQNIIALLGGLSGAGIDVSISMSREHLANLLGSAMMNGYFLRNAELRHGMEASLPQQVDDLF